MLEEDIKLSVIIPAYNEEKNISSTLLDIYSSLKNKGLVYEVILVDDGSEDDTVKEATKHKNLFKNFTIFQSKPNMGKGFVVRKGVFLSSGEYVLFMDADNSTQVSEIDKFLPYLEAGYDAVIGSRRLKESNITVSEPIMRIMLGQVYIFLSGLFIGKWVTDFNCGFKSYKSTVAKRLFSLQKMNDWSFDTELIFLINKLGLTMKEVPVKWEHKFTSKVQPIKAGINSFLSLIKIRSNAIKGLYRE